VEVTGLLDLSKWTKHCPGMRVIVRRELPHPGATLDAFEIRDGYRYRYRSFTTNTPRGQLAFLEARHRAHARVEDRIRTGKDTGLGHLPSKAPEHQQGLDRTRPDRRGPTRPGPVHAAHDQPELHRAEPKTLRYRLLHTAARITRGQRKMFMRLAEHWPWALAWPWPSPKPSATYGRSRSRPNPSTTTSNRPPSTTVALSLIFRGVSS